MAPKARTSTTQLLSRASEQFSKSEFEQALSLLDKILTRQPSNLDANILASQAYLATSQPKHAARCIKKAVKQRPDSIEILNLAGIIYQTNQEYTLAIKLYQRSLSLKAEQAETLYNLSLSFANSCQSSEALEFAESAARLAPSNNEFAKHYGRLLIAHEQYAEGWKYFDSRNKTAIYTSVKLPEWKGEELDNKTLLIVSDQGIGDEVMYSSCIVDLLVEHPNAELVLAFDARLKSIFECSFSKRCTFMEKDAQEPHLASITQHGADLKISMSSLPRFYKNTASHFSGEAYLTSNSNLVEQWKDTYNKIDDKLKVGISWFGGSTPTAKEKRSIPLNDWSPILSKDATFINLQYGDTLEERRQIKKLAGTDIYHWDAYDPLKDLDNFFAQLSALDLVISIDNATLHFAGALGVKTLALIPATPYFCWGWTAGTCRWYKSLTLLRQQEKGQWEKTLEGASHYLEQMITRQKA